MLTGKLVGFRFSYPNGLTGWHPEYRVLETGEVLVDPVLRQTEPEFGIFAPIESNDSRALRRLQRLLMSRVGTVRPLEFAVWREWWRRDPPPSA